MYQKLRKNLGAKNCEFSPTDIRDIVAVYKNIQSVERKTNAETQEEEGIAAKIFDNNDFGYYKVTIERPKRLNAQFTPERIAELRFDKSLREPMEWAFETFGHALYDNIKAHEKEIKEWCEKNELNLSAKQMKALLSKELWKKHSDLLEMANLLMQHVGTDEYNDFNIFNDKVDEVMKANKIKLSSSEKNAVLNAVSLYDVNAEKVIKGTLKLDGHKLEQLLQHLNCKENELADYGYYATGKKGEPASRGWYIEYETESDLRDTENVPLKDNIHEYFLREVKPHVEEGWINIDATKIGYEISFNKYFYSHKPLRSLEEVTTDILKLEEESEGLINEILNLA